MALIMCSECGKEIAESAKTCPSCGAPSKRQQEVDKVKSGFLAGLGLIILAPIVAIVGFVVVALAIYAFS